MKVGEEIYVVQWDQANGLVFGSPVTDEAERCVITHVGDHTNEDGAPLCWVEWVDRPMRHQANGTFRPAAQLFLENA